MCRSKNIIPDFTRQEIRYIIENANFTDQELQFFNLRNMEYSQELCAEKMNYGTTTIKKISKKTMNKVMKVVAHMEI